jgi:uncharacterized protein YjbI with pentapeptide repeats
MMSSPSDADLGRQAAQSLWRLGLDAGDIDDPLTPEFALAALAELEQLQKGTPGILREVLDGAQMQQVNLTSAALQGASLFAAQMQGAILRGTKLQGAVLTRAAMQQANLFGAETQGADLRRADLQGAILRGAEMQGTALNAAKLAGADLNLAKLQGSVLTQADLRGANCGGTNFRGALLKSADVTCNSLTQAQLDGAVGDISTILPKGLSIASCLKSLPEEVEAALALHPRIGDLFRLSRAQIRDELLCNPGEEPHPTGSWP